MKRLYGVLKNITQPPVAWDDPGLGRARAPADPYPALNYAVRWFGTRAEAEAYINEKGKGLLMQLEGGLVKPVPPPPPAPKWEEAE